MEKRTFIERVMMLVDFWTDEEKKAIVEFTEGDENENPWVNGKPKIENIEVVAYSAEWTTIFQIERDRIKSVLGSLVKNIEHIGSTAVPNLMAKPVIDIDLIVENPEKEEEYLPFLIKLGYELTVRERSWYQHRMFRLNAPRVNLHVFGMNCPEHIRHILFRDWLSEHEQDRQYYEQSKRLAKQENINVQTYNQNKQEAVKMIYQKIFRHHGLIKNETC